MQNTDKQALKKIFVSKKEELQKQTKHIINDPLLITESNSSKVESKPINRTKKPELRVETVKSKTICK